jgi:pimeloyl-ACP methyl ester carboxylesterase
MGDNFSIPYGKNEKAGNRLIANDISMYYECYGNGDPLVLIHGNGSSLAGMGFQIDYFKETFKVIAADSRGHGNSDLNTNHLTYEQMADDWIALLEKLGLTKINLFGWSDGGIIGLIIAIKKPDLIKKLAIMGANVKPQSEALIKLEGFMIQRAIMEAEHKMTEGNNSVFWQRKLMQLKLLKDQPDIAWTDLNKISSKVLVMAGEKDSVKESHTLEIHNQIPNSELCIFPQGTHYMPIESPAIFNERLEAFFTK